MKHAFLKIFLSVILLILVNSCHVGRYFYWNYADINDHRKFPQVMVATDSTRSTFQFFDNRLDIPIPEKYFDKKNPDLATFLRNNQTVAFLVVKNDTIVFEEYFAGYDETSVIPSFSVSKTFVSALVGIALAEGYFQNTYQSITDFLPELMQADSMFSHITLEDLLNMRSGIRFAESYGSPFSDMAKFYYGRHLKKHLTKLEIAAPANESYDYVSVNTLLLAIAIERATGMPLNDYLSAKIWQPLGMEYDATMNIDSRPGNQIKAFCCLNARTRDFARFGRLYLNGGSWQGNQIIPQNWIEKSMTVINNSLDSQGYPYTYHWRVKPDGAVFAKGVLGQYIYIDVEKNIIIVRLGKKSADVNWAGFFEDICGVAAKI